MGCSLLEQVNEELDLAIQAKDDANVFIGRFIFVSILLSVLIAISLAILTSKVITAPLQKLTDVAQKTTTDADFDIQVEGINQQDEIGLLAEAFNSMIVSVRELLQEQKLNNEQIKTYSQSLEQKVAEVEQKTQEINEQNNQLQDLLKKLQRTQSQMIQSEKMSSLGQMVAGIAHEINNPVSFIHGNLKHVQEHTENVLDFIQLYEKHYPDPTWEIQDQAEEIDLEFVKTDLPKIVNSMKLGTSRIREIILSLRTFSRIDESNLKAVDVHTGIDSTLLILDHRLKAQPERPKIEVIRDYGDLPEVECYPSQLNQVFMNILVNAIDAIEDVCTEVGQQRCHKEIVIRTSRLDSDWVKIAIADTGRGIPKSSQQKIFDPFFTTKDIGKGTGMGMSISYQIITENHQGKLSFNSSPGQGTEFVIEIPIRQQAVNQNNSVANSAA